MNGVYQIKCLQQKGTQYLPIHRLKPICMQIEFETKYDEMVVLNILEMGY